MGDHGAARTPRLVVDCRIQQSAQPCVAAPPLHHSLQPQRQHRMQMHGAVLTGDLRLAAAAPRLKLPYASVSCGYVLRAATHLPKSRSTVQAATWAAPTQLAVRGRRAAAARRVRIQSKIRCCGTILQPPQSAISFSILHATWPCRSDVLSLGPRFVEHAARPVFCMFTPLAESSRCSVGFRNTDFWNTNVFCMAPPMLKLQIFARPQGHL